MSNDDRPVVAAYRRYVLQLLDRDMAYDDDPTDDPPLLIADYRRALLAVLALETKPLLSAGPAVTEGEATSYLVGQQAAQDTMVIEIGQAWQPDRLRRRGRNRPATVPVLDEPDEGSDHGTALARVPSLLSVRPPDDNTRLLVIDGDGEVVASFDRSEFDMAHRWAHDRAAEPLTKRPVWIEDLGRRESWRIDPTSCRHRRWMPASPPLASARCPLTDRPPPSPPSTAVDTADTNDA